MKIPAAVDRQSFFRKKMRTALTSDLVTVALFPFVCCDCPQETLHSARLVLAGA